MLIEEPNSYMVAHVNHYIAIGNLSDMLFGGRNMIMRQWSARATKEGSSVYAVHFRDAVLPALFKIDGFVRGTLLEREDADECALTVQTLWLSRDAIATFAGDDICRAVVEPEAIGFLLDHDRCVQHLTVAVDESRSASLHNRSFV